MAEVLSLNAGLVDVSLLVEEATSILYQYNTATRARPAEVTALLQELTAFAGHLQTVRVLQERRQNDSDWSKSFTRFIAGKEWHIFVQQVLTRICDRIPPASLDGGSRTRRLQWPFTRSETIHFTERITDAKNEIFDALLHDST